MNEDHLKELLKRCETEIEDELLKELYPRLGADHAQELRAQYKIDYYPDMELTVPDFAFPYLQIAIYCDGFGKHAGNREQFVKDRFQSRELQLRGWIVLRFAGREINYNIVMVVKTIERAIDQRDREQARSSQQQHTQELPRGDTMGPSETAEAADTTRADFYFSRGKAKVMRNDYDNAIADLTKAIELCPVFAAAYHYRGVAYYYKGDYTAAIDDYNKSIDLLPESGSYNGRSAAYAKMGDRRRADEDRTRAEMLEEQDPQTQF